MGTLRRAEDGGLQRANQLKLVNARDYASILYESLGLPFPVERPSLTILPEARAWARGWLESKRDRKGALIGLNTGAAGRWRFKSWGIADTARLANALATRLGASVMILGGSAEAERNAEIVARADSSGVIAAPCDLSLPAFAALVSEADVLVSSDSLAMHIGIAQQRPVIAFFGPTSDSEIDLFGLGEKIITPLECRRCYLPDCEVLPHCMQSISIDSIFNAVTRWIPSPGILDALRNRSPGAPAHDQVARLRAANEPHANGVTSIR
jgi:ADP-heptose:LPS heptosyltransferase